MGIEGAISPIDKAIRAIDPIIAQKPQLAVNEVGGQGFGQILLDQLRGVTELQNQAEAIQQDFVAGKVDSLTDVIMAVQKADLALTFAIELRNKVIEAYQEISRTQL